MELLRTGQMIDQLRIGEEAEYKHEDRISDFHLVVQKTISGSIIVIKNGKDKEYVGKELPLNAKVMSYKWTITPKYVTWEKAMKAHKEEKKTIVYHQDDELKYEFKHSLDTGQFEKLSNDNICLHELLRGNWTIEN